MTPVEKERLCQRELEELRRLINLDLSSYPADVEAALRFIHAHLFEESLNASRVQRQEGLRSHNLPARFKRYLALGLRDYIEDRRIMAAMRLLWHEEVEIYLVAAAVGYTHHETFTRAFKRRVGCPPSQFRAHFARAPLANGPPGEPPSANAEPQPASFPAPQPREVLMFITDVVGIRTAEETHDLRVSGTATGVAEVYVSATASGEARTQVAEVGPDGRWVALFGGEEEVFACGRPLLVEVGSEGRTHVHWEGPLDCAEVAPRRARAQQEAPKEAVAEDVDSGNRSAARSHGGGNYAGDAAMTVTVATGRGPAPPPLVDTDEGDDDATPYYERARPKPPAQEQPPRVARPAGAPAPAERPSADASDEATRDLREEVAALRAQIDGLVHAHENRSPRAGSEEQGGGAVTVTQGPAVREESSEPSPGEPSETTGETTDDLREEIAALRRELHEQWERRSGSSDVRSEERDTRDRATRKEEERTSEEEGAAADEDAREPAWHREIRDLREQVESLRAKTEAQEEQEPQEEHGEQEAERPASRDVEDEPEWRRVVASLQDQIEALREKDATRRARSEEEADADTGESSPAEGGDSEVEEHDDAQAVSPRENRADLYDAVSALRERIAQLERSDANTERSDNEGEAHRPRPVRRDARTDALREEPPDDRGSGVLARQRLEDREVHSGQSPAHDRDASPPRREARSEREGLRREDTPIIKFEPFEVGDWTGEGRREVRVRVRVSHPSREPVAAELTDDRDDRVLADGRSERGTLTLDEWVEVEPGTSTFTVTVTEPAPARLSMAWTLDEPEARGEENAAVEEEEPDEEAGWVSRAIGGAWGIAVALFLLSLAAGVHGLLRGLVTAGFLGFFGSYLALTVPRRWGVWTAAGIGLFTLSLVALLPFTPIIQVDSYLLVAGLATLGLTAAAVVALFVSSD